MAAERASTELWPPWLVLSCYGAPSNVAAARSSGTQTRELAGALTALGCSCDRVRWTNIPRQESLLSLSWLSLPANERARQAANAICDACLPGRVPVAKCSDLRLLPPGQIWTRGFFCQLAATSFQVLILPAVDPPRFVLELPLGKTPTSHRGRAQRGGAGDHSARRPPLGRLPLRTQPSH